MISIYTGTPGSGKSLHVAEKIYYALKNNRPVIANFDIKLDLVKNPELFSYWDNTEITPANLYDYSREYFGQDKVIEEQILLIIDEAQILFNCRDWNAHDRSDWIIFFSQHRKLGYHIILVTQFDKMLDKQLRAFTEYQFVHRKVSNFGFKGKFLSIWTGNRLFVSIQMWYGMKEKISCEWFLYKKKFGELYDTYNMFDKKTSRNVQFTEPTLPDPEGD